MGEKAKMIAWMDDLINVYTVTSKFEESFKGVRAINLNFQGRIILSSGIDKLADAVEEKLCKVVREGEKFPYEFSFYYRNVLFVQVEESEVIT